MAAPICFLDTETTGLSLEDDIWEFAAIRRDPDGSESEHHMFIEHDEKRCRQLPDSFRKDHNERFDVRRSMPRSVAAALIADATMGAHIVGAVPNFDTERMALLLSEHDIEPEWHYHLIDVENLAVGWLAHRVKGEIGADGDELRELITPPWRSDDLSRACGVEPPTDERHTAMGDAKWARALYDAITGGA